MRQYQVISVSRPLNTTNHPTNLIIDFSYRKNHLRNPNVWSLHSMLNLTIRCKTQKLYTYKTKLLDRVTTIYPCSVLFCKN